MGKRNLGGFEKFQSVYSESKSIYRVYNQNHDSLNKWFAADMAFDHHHMLHGKTLILRKEILKVTPILHKGQEISEAIFLSFNSSRKPKENWHSFCIVTQCHRADSNKRSLPRPTTTTAWKLIPQRSKISKNWNPPHWVPLHRFFKNWFLLIQNQLYSNYIQIHFT